MFNDLNSQYQQSLIDYFNQRTNYDTAEDFHPLLANRLVELANLKPGLQVLDLATGTGLVAIAAAQIVAPQGKVLGVDLSPGMLAQAQAKINQLGLANIELRQGDVEKLNFAHNSFDVIFGCSSLPYLTDIPRALRHWHNFLKPGGAIAITGFSQTSFILGVLLREIALNYGVVMPIWNEITGDENKCHILLENAGFVDITVKTEQLGDYLTMAEAINGWVGILKNPLSNQMLDLDQLKLAQAKSEYLAKLEALATDQGIWNEITTFLIFGRKGKINSN